MRTVLDRYTRHFNAEGGSAAGGGDGGGQPATPPAGGAAPPAAPGGGGGAPGTAPPGAPPAAPAGTPPADAPKAYRPEGLADNLYGASDQETIDRMHKALNGYRERDSAKGVPDRPEAYRDFKIDEAPEALRPHLAELAKDPLFDAVAKVAHDEKIPVGTLQKLTTALYAQAAESGILEPPIDPVKERAALLPETAQGLSQAEQDRAIDARLQQNEDFIKLMTQPGADGKAKLDAKVGEHALLMLMDTAAGNQFLEFVRGQMTGQDRAQPLPGNGSGKETAESQRDALRTRAALPENTFGNPKFDRASWDALQEDYRKLAGG